MTALRRMTRADLLRTTLVVEIQVALCLLVYIAMRCVDLIAGTPPADSIYSSWLHIVIFVAACTAINLVMRKLFFRERTPIWRAVRSR